MPEMVEVVIDSIRVSLMNQQRIVILRDLDMDRYLAIWVGVYEAEHLTIALQEMELARPLTYDLFKNVINALATQILRVEIVALRDETFYGNIVMEADGKILNIDSRPSDALNLAIRANIPIFVAREVMEIAGIIPDEDELGIDDETSDTQASGEDRLSVFEDFLDNLNLDDQEHKDDK